LAGELPFGSLKLGLATHPCGELTIAQQYTLIISRVGFPQVVMTLQV